MAQTVLAIPSDETPGATAAQSYTGYHYSYTAIEVRPTSRFSSGGIRHVKAYIKFRSNQSRAHNILSNGGFETGSLVFRDTFSRVA